MSRITHFYGIIDAVPFVDLELRDDTRLFLSSARIRHGRDRSRWAPLALDALDSYSSAVARAAMSGDPRGRDVVGLLPEPKETRLGMSTRGCNGHGAAELLRDRLWESLTSDDLRLLAEFGVLGRIEAVSLFVPGIGNDVASDMTTRIIYPVLAAFTAQQMTHLPQLARRVAERTTTVWDPRALRWHEQTFRLPSPEGEPLLLVPDEWVGRSIDATATRFGDLHVLSHVQKERATVRRDGTVLTPTKKALRSSGGVRRGRGTNLAVTLRALGAGENLVEDFLLYVDRFLQRQEDAA